MKLRLKCERSVQASRSIPTWFQCGVIRGQNKEDGGEFIHIDVSYYRYQKYLFFALTISFVFFYETATTVMPN